jgi:hypothetical protein
MEHQFAKYIRLEFRPEFGRIVRDTHNNSHLLHVIGLSGDGEDVLLRVAEYILKSLPNDPAMEPDWNLGTVCLIASEWALPEQVNSYTENIRSFFLDAMLFAEGSGTTDSRKGLERRYEEQIRPLLNRTAVKKRA